MRYLPGFRWILFGLLVYVAILIASFPAERGYAHWKASALAQPNVQLSDLSGSVWAGQAGAAMIDGRPLTLLEWQFQPLAMLVGQVGLDWRARLPEEQGEAAYAEGSTRFGLNGSVGVGGLDARLPASLLASMAKAQVARPSGLVSINLNDLQWDGQRLESVTGRVVWNGAGINLFKPLQLGDLALDLETVDDEIRGVVKDSGGPLAIDGLVTLTNDGSYQLTAELSARPGLAGTRDLETALATIRRPGPDGKVQVRQSGNLADFGLGPRPGK